MPPGGDRGRMVPPERVHIIRRSLSAPCVRCTVVSWWLIAGECPPECFAPRAPRLLFYTVIQILPESSVSLRFKKLHRREGSFAGISGPEALASTRLDSGAEGAARSKQVINTRTHDSSPTRLVLNLAKLGAEFRPCVSANTTRLRGVRCGNSHTDRAH